MEERQCVRCCETKSIDEFYLTYKGEPSVRCRKCCDEISKDMVERIEFKMTYIQSVTNKKRGLTEWEKGEDYREERRKLRANNEKQYKDYINDAVESGEMSKSDGAYYKAQNRSAKLSGNGGVFHGRLINNK